MLPGRKGISRCRICGRGVSRVHELQDYRLKLPGKYRFMECGECGYGFLDPVPTPEILKELYEKYYPRDPNPPGQRGLYWLRYIANRMINSENLVYLVRERSGRLLDIGCGYGDALSFFRAKGFECCGIEIDSRAVSFCRDMGLNVRQCTTLDSLDYPDDYFDVIILAQVIEHVGDPEALFREMRRILKSDGKVYMTTPNFRSYMRDIFKDYWVSGWFLPFHLNLYSENSIRRYAGKSGLTVNRIYSKTPASWLTLCLKSFLYRNREFSTERSCMIFDNILSHFFVSPVLKLLDRITGRGDCLFAVFEKRGHGY